MEKKKLKYLFPYILLFALSFWQAYSFLKLTKSFEYTLFVGLLNFLVYFCLSQISVKLFKVILTFSLVLSIFYYPITRAYGWVDFNLIAAVLYTNSHEFWSYATVVRWENYFRLALETIAIIYLLTLHFQKISIRHFKYISLLALILLFFIGFKPTQKKQDENYGGKITASLFGIFPRVYHLAEKAMTASNHIIQQSKKPDNWHILNPDSIKLKQNFVVVIGESVRRDFLSCYGFTLEKNTPFISHSPHIQFNNYISVASHTVPSLARTIAYSEHFPNIDLNNNIVKLAKKAGYKTYWLSNQGYIGLYESPISVISAASDDYYTLAGGDSKTGKNDSDLLPVFTQILKNNKQPKFIVIHMLGSHPNPCRQTDGKYDKFVLSRQISCYLKTIKNLDSFLSKIYKALKENGQNFSLIYFSDHGLKINSDLNITHGNYFKQCYEVPLLIWGNNISTTHHIKAARQGRDFIKLFSEMNNIKTSNIKENYRFLSDEKSDIPTTLVVANGKTMDYTKFENNLISEFKK